MLRALAELGAARRAASDIDADGRQRQARLNPAETAPRSADLKRAATLIREVVGLAKEAGDVLELQDARQNWERSCRTRNDGPKPNRSSSGS